MQSVRMRWCRGQLESLKLLESLKSSDSKPSRLGWLPGAHLRFDRDAHACIHVTTAPAKCDRHNANLMTAGRQNVAVTHEGQANTQQAVPVITSPAPPAQLSSPLSGSTVQHKLPVVPALGPITVLSGVRRSLLAAGDATTVDMTSVEPAGETFSQPSGIAFDTANNKFWIATVLDHRIWMYDSSVPRLIEVVPSTVGAGHNDGDAEFARFDSPRGVSC
eukprot:365466-Chlamydomonas_euryale.AAC.17